MNAWNELRSVFMEQVKERNTPVADYCKGVTELYRMLRETWRTGCTS